MNSKNLQHISRRTLLGAGIGVAAMAGLSACNRFGGGTASASTADEISMMWWGDAARAEATEAMLDVYRGSHSDVTIKTEYADSGPYQDRMATRFAAGDVPDIMNQRRDGLREYADRGALLDLNEHLDVLDLSAIPDSAPLGRVGEALYGVPAGLNAVGFIIDETVTDRYGLTAPDTDAWSWDELWSFSKTISTAAAEDGKEMYGVEVDFATVQNLVVFIRQAGEEMYTAEGLFGASEKTLAAWFQMSVDQRKSGALAPAGFIETSGNSAAESPIASGLVAAQVIPTNNLAVFSDVLGSVPLLGRFPGEVQGARRGMSVDTAMYWSIGAKAANADGALELLNFMLNDVDGNAAVGATRGLPVSTAVAESIAADLSEEDRISMQYLLDLGAEDLPESRPDPSGGSEIQDALTELAVEVAFERATPREAAQRIRATAEGAMGLD